jgi:hypothetical protein
MEAVCEHWNMKINEDKTQAIYFYRRRGPVEAYLTLKGRNIPFVKDVKYLGVIFDRKITWRCHTETIATKALRTFFRIYSLLKSKRLSKSDFTLCKALIRSKMTYACPAWEFAAYSHLLKLQRLQNKSPPHHWQPTKAHTDPRFTPGVSNSVPLRLYNQNMQVTGRSHSKSL